MVVDQDQGEMPFTLHNIHLNSKVRTLPYEGGEAMLGPTENDILIGTGPAEVAIGVGGNDNLAGAGGNAGLWGCDDTLDGSEGRGVE
jgi:hypothetical protein